MDKLCFAIVTIITAFISLDTLRRLYVDRHRFAKEDLNDFDLAFIWRIVIFLIYPLLNLIALWVSVIACERAGGYVKSMTYGLLWYQVIPDELSSRSYLIPTLFSGEMVQVALVLVLLVSLIFRPHPFLAMLITYTCVFVLSVNLIVDPILSIFGFGSAHWQIALLAATPKELSALILAHFLLGALLILCINNSFVQKIFAELIKPVAMEKLKRALLEKQTGENNDLVASCNLVILYENTGLGRQANKQLKELKQIGKNSLLPRFVEAFLNYKRRNYKKALTLFLALGEETSINNELKSMFLAAAAYSAHATRDVNQALNLVERALEFDNDCLIARMIKIDIYIKQGNEEKAANEIRLSLKNGLDENIEEQIPIDWQKAISLIHDVDSCNKENSQSSKSANQGQPPL